MPHRLDRPLLRHHRRVALLPLPERISAPMKKLVAILALLMIASAPLFTEDQNEALRDFFASAENVRSFGAHPVNDLLRDPNNATFLKGFANKLLALRVY